MTQEEKAKRYDEALERMKSWAMGEHPECFTEAQKAAEFIFPELAESDDKRIRNGLIALLKFGLEDGSAIAPGFNETKEQALAWLEKQGETSPILSNSSNTGKKWSEEDECYIGKCISAIATKDGWSFEEKRETKHWLESIKQRMEESK